MGLENSSLQMLLAMSYVKSVVLDMSKWTAVCLCVSFVGFHCFSWSGRTLGRAWDSLNQESCFSHTKSMAVVQLWNHSTHRWTETQESPELGGTFYFIDTEISLVIEWTLECRP